MPASCPQCCQNLRFLTILGVLAKGCGNRHATGLPEGMSFRCCSWKPVWECLVSVKVCVPIAPSTRTLWRHLQMDEVTDENLQSNAVVLCCIRMQWEFERHAQNIKHQFHSEASFWEGLVVGPSFILTSLMIYQKQNYQITGYPSATFSQMLFKCSFFPIVYKGLLCYILKYLGDNHTFNFF